MVALSPWKPFPFKLEVQKITVWLQSFKLCGQKSIFLKKSSRTLILATCYSIIQSYFKIDLILTMLFNIYFLYRKS